MYITRGVLVQSTATHVERMQRMGRSASNICLFLTAALPEEVMLATMIEVARNGTRADLHPGRRPESADPETRADEV